MVFIVLLLIAMIVMLCLLQQQQSRNAKPVEPKMIACPYCDQPFPEIKRALGQTVICPRCHSSFCAGVNKAEAARVSAGIVYGVVLVIAGLLLIFWVGR